MWRIAIGLAAWLVGSFMVGVLVGRWLRGPEPSPVAERRRLVVVPDRVPPEWLREHGTPAS